MLAALVAAASAISESEEALGSRHHFAAYSCNHRTYNHWPRSRQSAELLGLPSILRASYPEGAIGEQHETVDVGAGALEETGAVSSLDGVVEQGLRTLRLSMVPPFLDWGPSELCKPVLSSVDIVNMSPDDGMTIKRVSTDENQFFYGADTDFEPVSVEPHANVSVPFLFLPQELGPVQSNVFVSTSVGDFVYKMQAVGIANAHGIEPITVRLAPGAKLKRDFPIYNPHSKSIRVQEVYTPEDAFQLQLPDSESGEASSQAGAQAKLWKIEPEERKTVIQLTFDSAVEVKVVGYISVQTDLDTFVIGVDVSVIGDKLLALPETINFGKVTEAESSQATQVVRLLNTHQAAIDCTSASQDSGTGNVSVQLLDGHHRILPGREIDALEVTFTGSKDGKYQGSIAVECTPIEMENDFTILIPYMAEVFTGSLQYRLGTVELVVGSDESAVERTVEVTNEFDFPLLCMAAFSLDPAFGVTQFAPGTVLQPGQLENIFGVTLNVTMARSSIGNYVRHKGVVGHELLFEDTIYGPSTGFGGSLALPEARVFGERRWDRLEERLAQDSDGRSALMPKSLIGRTRVVIVTNASVFTIPVAGYDGHLTFSPPEIDFNGMRPKLLRRRYFNITNHNPVPINVFSFTTYPCASWAKSAKVKKGAGVPGGVRVGLVSIRRPVERVLISGLVAAGRVNAKNLQNEEGGEEASEEVLTTLESGYSAQFVVEINTTTADTRKCEFEVLASVDVPSPEPATEEKGGASCKSSTAEVFKDKMPVRISSSSGEIAFNPPTLKFGPSFSGRLEELPLCVKSTYQSPVSVKGISSSDPRFYVLPSETGKDDYSIPANGRFCFNNVVFDPSKKKVLRYEEGSKDEGMPVAATLTLETNLRAKMEVGVSGSIIQPRIAPESELVFPVTQIGKESEMFVEIHNPSNFSITARLAQQMKANEHDEENRPFRLMKSLSGAGSAKVTYGATEILRGNERGRLGPIAYIPGSAQSVSDTLMIINNLTNTETIDLKGKGGTGILSFKDNATTGPGESKCFAGRSDGGGRADSQGAGCRVRFEMQTDDLQPLLDGSWHKSLADGTASGSFAVRKMITARNSGDLPMAITQIVPRSSFLTGSAVAVAMKAGRKGQADSGPGVVTLQPKDEFQFEVTVTADYSMARFESIVDMSTSTGNLHVPIAVTIPRDKLDQAYRAMREAEETTVGQGLWTLSALALTTYVCSQIYGTFMGVYERELAPGSETQGAVPPAPVAREPPPTVRQPPARPASGTSKPVKGKSKKAAATSAADTAEMEAWKQERIRCLRDVLGNVSTRQVEALLVEADWEEERAADLFFQEVQKNNKKDAKAAEKQRKEKEKAVAKERKAREVAAKKAAAVEAQAMAEEAQAREEEKRRKREEAKAARKAAKAEAAAAEEHARVQAALKEEREHRKALQAEKQRQKQERKQQEAAQLMQRQAERREREIQEVQRKKQQRAQMEQANKERAAAAAAAASASGGQRSNGSHPWKNPAKPPEQMTHREQQQEFEAERKRLQQERMKEIMANRQAAAAAQQQEAEEPPAWDMPSAEQPNHSFGMPTSFVADPPAPPPAAEPAAASTWGGSLGAGLGWGAAAPAPASPQQPSPSGSLGGSFGTPGSGTGSGAFGAQNSPLDAQLGGSANSSGFNSFGGGGFFGSSSGGTADSALESGDPDVDQMFGDISKSMGGLLDEDEEELIEDDATSRPSLFNRGRSGSVGSIDTVSDDSTDEPAPAVSGLGLGTTLWGS